ncbi:hypothetical protein CKO28_06090 [Rhodovibrio sodomensis]|uniref:Uncharacterized protein n=1 Tax=Rhodovibrio sodomensis TaxID=1088 RepID=A0ABS1DAX6_9PROT|nr:hypothetical protein [Rhodovibrio sodomensis]
MKAGSRMLRLATKQEIEVFLLAVFRSRSEMTRRASLEVWPVQVAGPTRGRYLSRVCRTRFRATFLE